MAFLSQSYPASLNFIVKDLANKNSKILLVRLASQIVGYSHYHVVADEIHLLDIATHPDFLRQGIATTLFQYMVDSHPLNRLVYLEVRVSNQPALRFYENLGFKKVGRRERYYQDGEDALVMKR